MTHGNGDKKKEVIRTAIDKITMVDAGNKASGMKPMKIRDYDKQVFYPCLHLSGREAPMLKGVNIGDRFKLVLDVVVKACSSRKGISGEELHDYDLEIRKVGKEG